MTKSSVLCLASSLAQAEVIVDRLKEAGCFSNDISVLLPDKHGSRDFALEKGTKAPEGAIAGVGTGAVIGGALGWLAGIGMLALPGMGPLVAAGPIAAGLSAAAVGGAVGGVAGSLIGWGFPEYEAKRYEGKIRDGGILISVHTENRGEVKVVREVFESAGAQDISVAAESSRGVASEDSVAAA